MKDFLENLQVEVPDEDKLLREIDDIEKKEINLTNDDEEKRTALHLACDLGFTKLVKKIIAKGADVNLIDGYKLSPLMTVCSLEDVNIELIKALLEKEPDLYHVTGKKNNALHIAIINKHTEVVKIIIDHLKENKNTLRDILQQKNKDGFTPIDLALINNDDNISDYLIKSVNSPNLKDSWIRIYGLSTDDSVKQRGAKKKSELMAQKQKVDEEKQRIENLKNKTVKEDKTIPEDLLRLLGVFRQNRGSFTEDQWTRITDTNTGLTLLHAASYIGDNDSADELLAMKAVVNIQDKGNKTPLDYAKTELMKDLLKKVGGKTGQELERERLDQEREMLEAQEKDRQQSLSKKESDSQDAQTLTNDQRIRLISDAHHDGDEDEELSVAVRVGQLDQRSSLAIIPYENIDADFQARLREYHLHTTHSDNQNVCYNPQLKKELLGSGSSGVSDFHKTLGAQAEDNRNKNYSKVTLLESPEKKSLDDYGLASQDALDDCTLKTFPLPDGVKLNMAVDKANGKVYLSKTSIAEIKRQGLTLSIKIPSKTGGDPEYLEFINGVLHIVDTPIGESRIAGKGELHGLAGYQGKVQTYSGQLTLTNGHNSKIASFDDKDSAEDNNPSDDRLKRKRSNSLDGNILSPSPSIKRSKIAETSFPDLFAKQESSREALEEKQKELVQVLRSQIEKGTVDKESVRAVSDEIDENNRKRLYRAASPSKTTAIVKEALKATSFGRAVGKRLFPLGLGNEAEEKLTKEQKTKDELNEHLDSSLTSTNALLEEIHSLEESYKQVSDEIQFLQGAKQAFFEKIQAEFKDDSTEWWKDHYENKMTESQKIALLKAGPEKAFEEAEKIAKRNNQEFVKRDVFNYMAKRDDITSHTSEKQEEIKGVIKKVVGHLAPLNEAIKLHFEQKATKSSQRPSGPSIG